MRGKKNPIFTQFSTRAHEVIWAHFTDLISKDNFQYFIQIIRKEREDRMVYDKTIRKKRFKSSILEQEYILFVAQEIQQFCKRNNLHYTDFVDLIDYYIIYDKAPNSIDFENAYNLCIVEDKIDREQKADNKYWQESDDLMYPVSIRINPNVGIKMLLNFIEKTFETHIKPRQKRYLNTETKIKIPRIKRCKDRDNFILQHKNLKIKVIKELLEDKMKIFLSESQITEIIRRKTRR